MSEVEGAAEHAAEHTNSASEHLQHATTTLTFHVDTMLVSWGIVALLVFVACYVGKNMTAGTPGRFQNLIESLIEFINQTVKDNFPYENKLLAPLALTIFVYVLICNTIGELPTEMGIKPPSADLNMTLALALSVFFLVHYYGITQKGVKGYIGEYLYHPFGKYLMPVNILMKIIEEIAKPLSLSFRLFGNIFAGEIIFLLIAMLIPWWLNWIVGVPWIVFHLLVGFIQAFVFMILTVVYVSMAYQPAEEH